MKFISLTNVFISLGSFVTACTIIGATLWAGYAQPSVEKTVKTAIDSHQIEQKISENIISSKIDSLSCQVKKLSRQLNMLTQIVTSTVPLKKLEEIIRKSTIYADK